MRILESGRIYRFASVPETNGCIISSSILTSIVDLAVVAALLSSYEDVAINNKFSFSGEVGLGGEIRAVNKVEQRVAEASKLGYEKIFISKYNQKVKSEEAEINLIKTVAEFYKMLF